MRLWAIYTHRGTSPQTLIQKGKWKSAGILLNSNTDLDLKTDTHTHTTLGNKQTSDHLKIHSFMY